MNGIGTLAYIAGRVLIPKIKNGLRGLEPGRYPKWFPIILVPKSPELTPGQEPTAPQPKPKIQITGLGFALGFGAFIYILKKWAARQQAELTGDEGLFPGLRRELRLDQEGQERSILQVDPVEDCMNNRYGWNVDRMREMRDRVAAKSTPDMFGKEEELTGAEAQFLEQIEDCLARVEEQYGSLEAAGLALIPCPTCELGDEDEEETSDDGVSDNLRSQPPE